MKLSKFFKFFSFFFLLSLYSLSENYSKTGYLTFENKPLGSIEKPLIVRTYVPSLGVNPDKVLTHHSQSFQSPKYSPSSGRESVKFYDPIDGVPATIAVNLGKTLSYVWDTTECRLLYGWTDGFFDMKNYWGERTSGRRRGFGYVPRLYGFVFFKARGFHPLKINGKSMAQLGAPNYKGYSLGLDRLPVFDFQTGPHRVTVQVRPGPSTQTLRVNFTTSQKDKLEFDSPNTQVEILKSSPGLLKLVIRPNAGDRFSSDEKKIVIQKPTREIGERLYTTLGCIACHSLDGGKNHGPTLKGCYGNKREFLSAESLVVDDHYLRESIEKPMAKTVQGYIAGMMPPYKLESAEYDALILFIKSLR